MPQLPETYVRKIATEVPLLTEIPLFGYAPSFDWHHFSSLLAERLGVNTLKNSFPREGDSPLRKGAASSLPPLTDSSLASSCPFEVRSKNQLQRSAEELREGLSSQFLVIPLTLTPLSSPVYWAMGHRDIEKLTSWMLNGNAKGPAFSSEILQEGFYRYLLLQALDAASLVEPFQNFTPQLGEEASLPETGSFCIDVELSFDSSTCWGRLMVPETFRKEWVRHFSHLPSEYTPSAIARQTPLILGIKTGSVTLEQSDWKRLKPGDCLVLDQGSYDARRSQGTALLMLGSISLFQVKIKQNKIELLDFSFHPEESMEEKPTQELEASEEEPSPIKELPLNIVVEIARVKITLDQLMHLNPGNTLELPIHPDQGVSLTINGQKIGRAELVYLGETLSIRLLEIG